MAAPMDDLESKEEEKNDEELDVLSPNFNPLKALYASNLTLPVTDASVFNNLAEYERFMSKSGEESDKAREQKSAPPSRRALERRHLEHMREKEKELPKSTFHQKKRFQLNVLSRMESEHTYESPLDLLRQCVEKRCKVRVCIRSFKGLRSICIGYLVAFDKIWNMALSDVVEIYKRPSTGKRFHHEEKVTYSMIMSNLNPQPKKPHPATLSQQEQTSDGKKRAKECKFCRIKHETLMEQQAAKDSREADSSLSWSETDTSSSSTEEYSSTEESSDNVRKEGDKVESGRVRRKQKTPKKSCGLCPNGHERPQTQSGRTPQSSNLDNNITRKDISGTTSTEINSKSSTSFVSRRVTSESSDSLWRAASSSGPDLAEKTRISTKYKGASVKESEDSMTSASTQESKMSSAKSSSSSSTLSAARKSELLLSRMTTPATKLDSVSTAFTGGPLISTTRSSTTRSSITRSSTTEATQSSRTSTAPSSSLSQEFSKSLTIGKKSGKVLATERQEEKGTKISGRLLATKKQEEKETKPLKEVVHLDPKTGKRLIQPEEFKRRYVNQLFIRGDQVVLVSVDSEMVEVDLKKAGKETDEKSSVKSQRDVTW